MASPPTRLDFKTVALAAAPYIPDFCARWLPDGKRQGNEWIARNPHRSDAHLGSFSINLRTGSWSDFASGDRGSDIISLAAFLHHSHDDYPQLEAARGIMRAIGLTL